MKILKVKCPSCQTEGSLSLLEADYEGPYRCWKCRGLFTLIIENDEVKSFTPLTEEELEKQQAEHEKELKMKQEFEALKEKFRRQ